MSGECVENKCMNAVITDICSYNYVHAITHANYVRLTIETESQTKHDNACN